MSGKWFLAMYGRRTSPVMRSCASFAVLARRMEEAEKSVVAAMQHSLSSQSSRKDEKGSAGKR